LPGADTAPFFTGDTAPALSAIGEFITGERIQQVPNRTLATVMFTDIVGSTRQAAELGDARWIEILERHRQLTRQYISRYRGTEVNTTGDGFLATFDGPTRAVTCAADLVAAVQGTGVELRAGLHTGEIEEDGSGDIGGLAVHIASRVADAFKEPGVVVSSTVKDLVTGSGILFDSIGEVELKGIPGSWSLHRVLSVP
jgi:class 3 adenylate cyclase